MPTQNFRVGEMLNKRTRNSKTWINFDGSYTTEIYSAPVHYEDENGNLHNIDTDLYDESDLDKIDFPVAKEGAEVFRIMRTACRNMKKKNILDRELMDYQGLKVPFDCRIPRNFKRGYTVGKGENKLRFIPVGASTAKGYIEQERKNCVHYQDAWNDVDVRLELLPTGIKETLVLKSDRAPVSFSFEVDGPLEDDLTAGNLKLQPAWLVDANGERRDVVQTVRREGDKTYVDLVADVTGLTYPIEIDPTTTIQVGSDYSAWFQFGYDPDSGYTDETALHVGVSSSGRIWVSWVSVNLSSIPSGSVVNSAAFHLYFSGIHDNAETNNSIPIRRMTKGFNGYESVASSVVISGAEITVKAYESAGWKSTNITSVVRDWINGVYPNYGLGIGNTGGSYGNQKSFNSQNAGSNIPYLTVTYNDPPTAPTVTAPNGGETWNAQHKIEWNAASDVSNLVTTYPTTSNISYMNILTGAKVGQTFTIDNDKAWLKRVGVYLSGVTGENKTIKITGVGANGLPNATVYGQTTVFVKNPQWYFINLTNPTKFPAVTKLAVEITNTINQVRIYGLSDLNYSGGDHFSDSSIITGFTAAIQLEYDEGAPSSAIQYHIQLTTNNGQSWKDIVPLTSPGATSYDYDFINEPETSLAKIRIRAYDGTSYGPWDESDGVFTIQHNRAPTVPTSFAPSGGIAKDRASVIRLSWQHNDANNDPQAKFDLQWRAQGTQTWNTVTQVTTNQFWDAPANTFPRGTIEWQVRTYDQAGLSSPYSDTQAFFAGDKPASPTITDPTNGATVPVANPVVQWSSDGQTAFTLKVKDMGGIELYQITGGTNKAVTIQYDLANRINYQIELTIQNADGLTSDPDTVNILVSYTPPAVPAVTPSTDSKKGAIVLTIDNPVPIGTEPNVSYNSVFRRKQRETQFIRIATNLAPDTPFTDYTPASDQVYEYFVRAWGENGTYRDSVIVSQSIILTGVWLHDVTNPEGVYNFKLDGDGRSNEWQAKAIYMQFAGRLSPVTEFSEHEDDVVNAKIKIMKDSGEHIILERLLKSKNTLCYRDGRGRRIFGTTTQLTLSDQTWGYDTEIAIRRTSYSEVV